MAAPLNVPWFIWALVAALVPLVWWMHHRFARAPTLRVAAVFPWNDAVRELAAPRHQPRADPIWRLRAAALAALVLALAGAQWQSLRPPPLTVWLDDSLSMLTVENGSTRIRTALAALALRLDGRNVQLRALSDPGAALGFAADDRSLATTLESHAARARAPVLVTPLDASSEHWLVSDGADPRVNSWARAEGVHRILQHGSAVSNWAVTELTLRRSLRDPEKILGLARVFNADAAAGVRPITVTVAGKVTERRQVALDADQIASLDFSLPVTTGRVEVTLDRSDALAEDDSLSVDLASLLPTRFQQHGRCAPSVEGALARHPGLAQVAAVASPELHVVCATDGASVPPDATRVIRLHAEADFVETSDFLVTRNPLSQRIAPLRAQLRAQLPPAIAPDATVLLHDAARRVPLIVAKGGVVEVYLDLSDRSLRHSGELVAVIDSMISAATGRSQLDPIVSVDRAADESRAAPRERGAVNVIDPTLGALAIDLGVTLIVFALALISLDVWIRTARSHATSAPDSGSGGWRRLYRNLSPRVTTAWPGIFSIVLLSFALFNPAINRRISPTPVLLLDESLSMRALGGGDVLRRWLEENPRIERVLAIHFAAKPLPPMLLATESLAAPPGAPGLDTSSTDIELALRDALRVSDTAHPIVLVSDGIETEGSATALLRAIARPERPIYFVDPTAYASDAAPRIVAAVVPQRIRSGQPFDALIELVASTDLNTRIDSYSRGRLLASHTLQARRGSTLHRLPLIASAAGPMPIEFVLADSVDGAVVIDRRRELINVLGKASGLYVVAAAREPPLLAALTARGWPMTRIRPPGLAAAITDHAFVVLDNVSLSDASEATWRALMQSVRRNGTGLIVLGGDRAFGGGGYLGAPIEEIFPVVSEAGSVERPAAVMFVIDRSGSMGTRSGGASSSGDRLEHAKDAILASTAVLGSDAVGIVAFDGSADIVLPLASDHSFESIVRALAGVRAFGTTALTAGVGLGLDALAANPLEQRLLVLVTDGFARSDDLHLLEERITKLNVSVIALAIGDDADVRALEQITRANDAMLLRVDDVTRLPRLLPETLGAKRAPLQLGRVDPIPQAPVPYPFRRKGVWPAVDGYSVTRARPDAAVHLATEDGDPLWASRRAGLGLVVALPAGFDELAPAWSRWPDFAEFAGGLVEWVAGTGSSDRLRLQSETDADQGQFDIDALDSHGDWLASSGTPISARIGSAETVALVPARFTAPGRLMVTVPRSVDHQRLSIVVGAHQLTHDFFDDRPSERYAVHSMLRQWRTEGIIEPWPASGLEALHVPFSLRNTLAAAAFIVYSLTFLKPLLIRRRSS